MKITVAQLIVTKDIQSNLKKISFTLESSHEKEWVIFPEGMLSGYYPQEDSYPKNIDFNSIEQGINVIKDMVSKKRCNCIFGTAYFKDEEWYNSSIFIGNNKSFIYHKNNLATLDRRCFKQGNEISTLDYQGVRFGIQMCRELVFPEQWKLLKHQGAQIIFHINNAIKIEDEVRSHLLVTRAYENQYFVCSVNNADYPQTQPSVVIAPNGGVLFQSKTRQEQVTAVKVNLSLVKNDYVNQERKDLVYIESFMQ